MKQTPGVVGSIVASVAFCAGCLNPAPDGPGTLLECGGAFVTPATDAKNCGACGHDCQGGDCVAGACQRVIIVSGDGNTSASSYGGLALDADHLYWTDDLNGVVSWPIAGGAHNTIVPSSAAALLGGIAVGGDAVYWTAFSTGVVLTASKSGQGMTTLASGQASPDNIAVDDKAAYWTNAIDGSIGEVAVGGGPSITLATGSPTATIAAGIAIDAGYVYWTDTADGSVNRIAKTSTQMMPTTIASDTPGVTGIAVDASNVYWGNLTDGNVWSVPVAGGNPVTLASGQVGVSGVAVDGGYVYWTLATTRAELRRVKTSGGEVETLGMACSSCPSSGIDVSHLVIGPGTIYWTNANLVVRIAR